MPRYKLTIEYDGGPYKGFQSQANGPSVQDALEAALERFTQKTIRIFVAGRTDSGVHALGQVIHFDLERARRPYVIENALNHHLKPEPIAVLKVEEVSEDFHARFSATARHYWYRIINRPAPLTIDAGHAWQVAVPLDADAMNDAAKVLLGTHDFTTFRAAQCQAKSPVKTLDRLDIMRVGDEVHAIAEARSFLHHQVRSMVGSLKLVGEGKWTAADLEASLEAKDRNALGLNAPPDGLYLTRVIYDEAK
ncbi:MAG: tRNA pseudouridine(38-40) synthase TruA [Alphaproteobacteria bacterium]|nr:tRNA pseudouridine(38-40) synthase TruA [Alphaproteobacteria bacterium]